MLKKLSNQSKRYGLATIGILLLTVLLDRMLFSSALQEREQEEGHKPPIAQKSIKEAMPEANVSKMAFVELTLPPPPTREKAKISAGEGNVERELLPTDPKAASVVQAKAAELNQAAKASPKVMNSPQGQSTERQIENVLNQLAALDGADRSLYFPKKTTKRILEYMHSCIGIDVGAVAHNSLTVLSHKNRQHSHIVRVANGYRTRQEQALLDIYAPNQALVRLYPISFDEALGRVIVNELGLDELTQLSGQYMLQGNSLWLTNITINHKTIPNDWRLTSRC
jgi:hypothetical protein